MLLWACIEDYAGLWELLWEAKSKLSDYGKNCQKSMVREAVLTLIKMGYITLYQCKEPYGETDPLTIEDAVSAVDDEHNWMAPEFDRVSIRASATEEGGRIHEAGEFNDYN